MAPKLSLLTLVVRDGTADASSRLLPEQKVIQLELQRFLENIARSGGLRQYLPSPSEDLQRIEHLSKVP